jgi:flagellar M-ring protein FliF
MIIPMLGENKASVRVYANLDFTQQEEAKEQYDPDKKVLRSEQSVSEQSGSGGASGAPGSLSNTPPSSDAEKPASAGGGQSDRSESTKNYEVGKSVSYKKSNFAKVTSLSAAVIVDNETVVDPKTGKTSSKPLDQDKINKITELVKATIGYDEARGDKVTVINSSFNIPKKEEVTALKPWDQPWFWDTMKKMIGMLLGFGFLFLLYRRLSAYAKKVAAEAPKGTVMLGEFSEDGLSPQMLELKNEQINRLRELANREPARVASVIKNWVGK